MSVTFVPDRLHYLDEGVNLANANARAILRLLGEPSDDPLAGEWEVADLPRVRRAIVGALNSIERRRGAVRPSTDDGGPGTGHARLIDCGLDDDGLVLRLARLLALVVGAQERGVPVVWG